MSNIEFLAAGFVASLGLVAAALVDGLATKLVLLGVALAGAAVLVSPSKEASE